MKNCSHCGREVADEVRLCPNCGAEIPAVWPPQIHSPAPPPPAERLVAGHPKGDFALGLVIALASLFLFGLGLLVMPILYLVLRSAKPPYKAFARGIGWGALVGWALILGAVAWCFYGLSHEGYHG